MIRKKLDLNGLLSKYEGIVNSRNVPYYNSPDKDNQYVVQPNRDNNINQDFYQSRAVNIVEEGRFSQPLVGNFQMSKSECEQFLMRMRNELRNQEKGMQNFAENAHKVLHEKFRANHEKIRREILELLDRAFKDNEQYISEELRRQGSSQPSEFLPVQRRIAAIDEDINRLLYGLKSADYRKSIAETVLKDFSGQLMGLRDNIRLAEDSYINGLGEVEPDRVRIDCIRQDLQKLFKISKRNTVFDPMSGVTHDPTQSQFDKQQNPKQKKSYFNFA